MAIIKATKGGQSLARIISYVAKKAEIISGKDCADDPSRALNQMLTTKAVWDKTDGRQYFHYVQSFGPGEVSSSKAHEIGIAWAEKAFSGYEVYIATHTDKDHIHNHFVINSVNYDNGHKIQISPIDLNRLKIDSDDICAAHGLNILDRTHPPLRGDVRTYSMEKYQTMVQGKSWVAETARALDTALTECEGKGFIALKENMKTQGYEVEYRGKKHITITDQQGNKIRANTLAKDFSDDRFTREGIKKIINNQIEQVKEPVRNLEIPKMQSVADIGRSVSGLGTEAVKIGQAIQQIIKADPKSVALSATIADEQELDVTALTQEQLKEKIRERTREIER